MNTEFRFGRQEDLNNIYNLLRENGLTVADLVLNKVKIMVATREDTIIGCIGLEEYGTEGLLRSFAVLKEFRKKGIGDKLFRSLLKYCSQNGVNTLHLLTETSENYFNKKGFILTNRNQAPDPIKSTSEFADLCPSTCAYMVKRVS